MPRTSSRSFATLACLTAVLCLAACATQPPDSAAPPWVKAKPTQESSGANPQAGTEGAAEQARIYKGTGQLLKGQLPGGGVSVPPPGAVAAGPAVTLNFEAADLRDVVRNILADILNESYTIEPQVGGTVTIRTTTGIPREALPATLEMLLRMNGAAMVKEGSVWKILPAASAARGNLTPQLGSSSRPLPPGYSVQIVPLRYMGVRQMASVLEPFVKEATTVRVDELRNLLILSGTELELRHLLETIDMFDVNWIAGMSVGLFTLQSADVKTVMAELEKAMGPPDRSPLAGILRIIPIERMNALLIVTPQPEYLDEAKKWIERLDKGGEGSGVRFYVYQVQNSRAERIGPLLQQAFTGRVTQQPTPAPSVAPGTPAGTIVSPPAFQPQTTAPVTGQPSQVNVQVQPSGAAAQAVARAVGDATGVVRNIQVVADKDNNTVLIVATPAEYSIIESALRKLDVPQRQVVMEVTIAEVLLTDDLQFGVEWLFRGGAPSGRGSGGNLTSSTPFNPQVNPPPSGSTGLSLAQGFLYIINNAAFPFGVQAVLHLLDQYGSVKVIANPHLAALDNQKATIKVGDRIPICQQSVVGGTVNGVVNTTSQYIDTGVLLQVTPHINAGGLVTLDVQAEVSIAGATTQVCEAPPINTRSIQTLLAVPTGQTMVMGGLILEDKEQTSSGLPVVSRIPILGGLFGSQELKNNRTELVMFITPRVVENETDVRRIVDDLRRRMEQLDQMFPVKKTVPEEPPSQ
ncbi:MAG TPA: type II secretion system secretin GspD [Casimicrobiaceae bacterium]|nr:type II secretion system secretin GspD [Casimicrobiaceae bacterium]